MDTDLLKTFLEVEKTRHFGRAAENLYLTQSAVSARIRQLESILGNAIFNRHRNNINLTPAGERLKPHAEAVLTSWRRAVEEASLGMDQTIQLAIGATANLWDLALQGYIHTIFQEFPGLAIRAEAHSRELLSEYLLSRTIDIAFLFDPPKVEELIVEPLFEINLILVSSFTDANINNVFDRNYVKVDWGTAFDIQHANIVDKTIIPQLHTTTGRIALDFILENGGSCFLPSSIALPYVESKQFLLIEAVPEISRSVFYAYLETSEKMESIRRALNIIKGQEPESAMSLSPNPVK